MSLADRGQEPRFACHNMEIVRHRIQRLLLAFATLAVVSSSVSAQVSVAELKAAFLFNFARFTEWPAEALPPGSPIVLCVLGDADVAQSLGRAVQGKSINGHGVLARRIGDDAVLRVCHILYGAGLEGRRAQQVLDVVKDAPVLTISDTARFTAQGGTAHLFMEGERMRFAVNVEAAQRASLRISAQLLSLARIVKGDDGAQ